MTIRHLWFALDSQIFGQQHNWKQRWDHSSCNTCQYVDVLTHDPCSHCYTVTWSCEYTWVGEPPSLKIGHHFQLHTCKVSWILHGCDAMLLKSVHRQTDRQTDIQRDRQTDKDLPENSKWLCGSSTYRRCFQDNLSQWHTHARTQTLTRYKLYQLCQWGRQTHTQVYATQWKSLKVLLYVLFLLLWLTWMAQTGSFLSTQKINSLTERAHNSDNCTTFNNKFPPNQRKIVHDWCLYHQWQREINRRPSWQGSLYINVDKKGKSDNENTDGLPE